jgi:hypothetical protein
LDNVETGCVISTKYPLFYRSNNEWKDEERDNLQTILEEDYLPAPEKPHVLLSWAKAEARRSGELDDGFSSPRFLMQGPIPLYVYVDDIAPEIGCSHSHAMQLVLTSQLLILCIGINQEGGLEKLQNLNTLYSFLCLCPFVF